MVTPRRIYCDMDGVLVDFNAGIKRLTGKDTEELSVKALWRSVGRARNFFERLGWTPDGQRLWKAIRHLDPIVLTGVPNSRPDMVGAQKARWCRREFQCRVNLVDKAGTRPQEHRVVSGRMQEGVTNVISCWTRYKHLECRVPGSILIDDREKLEAAWVQAGGVFVHHVNTDSTLSQLRQLGVLSNDP